MGEYIISLYNIIIEMTGYFKFCFLIFKDQLQSLLILLVIFARFFKDFNRNVYFLLDYFYILLLFYNYLMFLIFLIYIFKLLNNFINMYQVQTPHVAFWKVLIIFLIYPDFRKGMLIYLRRIAEIIMSCFYLYKDVLLKNIYLSIFLPC